MVPETKITPLALGSAAEAPIAAAPHAFESNCWVSELQEVFNANDNDLHLYSTAYLGITECFVYLWIKTSWIMGAPSIRPHLTARQQRAAAFPLGVLSGDSVIKSGDKNT